jgi:hypothetical protein
MGVLVVVGFLSGTRDDVEMAFGADAEPGVTAIVKWLGDAIETDDSVIKIGTDFQIDYIIGDMIELSYRFTLRETWQRETAKADDAYQQAEGFFVH